MWMQMLAQGWVVLQLTDSASALGLTIALQSLPILVLGAWGGVIADRIDNRRLLAITNTVGLGQALCLGVMQATGSLTVHWVWFFAVVLGAAISFDRPAMQSFLYELSGPDDLSSAVGMASTINAGGRLLGPAAAGGLIAVSGIGACFLANAISYGAILVALHVLDVDALFPRRPTVGGPAKLRDGLAYAWRRPVLRLGLGVMLVVGMFAYNFATTSPSMIRFVFHAGAGSLGVVQGISGIGAVLAGVVAAGIRRPSTRLLGLTSIAFGLLIVATGAAPNLVVFGMLWFPLGMASAAFMTVIQTVLQHHAAPEYQGRIMSLFMIAWLGTTPIGGLLLGRLIDATSARVALGVGGAATFLAGVVAVVVTVDQTGLVAAPAAVPEQVADAEEEAVGT
jgi:MFS family permease